MYKFSVESLIKNLKDGSDKKNVECVNFFIPKLNIPKKEVFMIIPIETWLKSREMYGFGYLNKGRNIIKR